MSQKRRRRRKLSDVKAAYLKSGVIYNRRGEYDKAKVVLDPSCESTYQVLELFEEEQNKQEKENK